MKHSLVADGEARLRACEGFQSRLRELQEAVSAKYAQDLKQAGFFRRILIRRRIAAEFKRVRREIEPSKHSLYINSVAKPR